MSQHSLVGSAPNPQRVNAWQSELTPRQVEIFESIAADLLLTLGYPVQFGLEARPISSKERVASQVYDGYRRAINWYRVRRRIRLGLAHR